MKLSADENGFLMGVAHFLVEHEIEWHAKDGQDRPEFWAYVPFGFIKAFTDAFRIKGLDDESCSYIKIELRSTYIAANMSDCLYLMGFEDTDLFVENACWTDSVRFSSAII